MKAPIYSTEGKEVGSIELPEALFGARKNTALIQQVVTAMQANARAPLAHAKDRGEARGGGKKPWKQKGTGRARHGSRRSPIWRGGGTTHGPRPERDYGQKINKKMRARALASVISTKMKEGEVIFVDSATFAKPATASAKAALMGLSKVKGFTNLGTRRKNAALFALPKRDLNAEKSFRNMGNVSVVEARNLNPVELLTYRYLVIASPEESVAQLAARLK